MSLYENKTDRQADQIVSETTDLSRSRQGEVAVACYGAEHYFSSHEAVDYGLRYALAYFAGLGLQQHEKHAALQYLERTRGTPDFPRFVKALAYVQNVINEQRNAQEAAERRKHGPVVEDATKTQRDLKSANPNLTKSYARNPKRLKIV
ncbi:hypothetical protein A6M27_18040 [Acidithiobacillus thiooxidans]|uniref:Uncharacterized protein n=1 Tax=Acidithiobacillus thiooxidans TaxID=930 RepID=A0A1C2J181_ACITH|nr:hypothetical protein [Acidithiobacillus thiooxidans]OCX69665.1 hypothetical protein A6P07_16020 [Acidithiobacillus thiooxidans]OCX75791.1 hypothetical protein A6O24_09425 [Acidithiobacillus thiooxidans]OCX82013.1 hypothetical protein A6O26_11115 [Acidithiobacillus thiooxidans]OCX83057.1 hypothetical protein A6M27_18040 [Acidithiobacillus thiooxidans]OFC43535.1 hypothetical protein BAE47_13145 [Acidithiobacillus thiooxidans]